MDTQKARNHRIGAQFEGGRFVVVTGHVPAQTIDVDGEHDGWITGEIVGNSPQHTPGSGARVWINLANVVTMRDVGA